MASKTCETRTISTMHLKKSKLRKISTRFDERTEQVQEADLAPSNRVIHISILKKGETLNVLLNPSEWHERMLRKAKEIKGFEIVKKEKYYVHVFCKYETLFPPLKGVAGVDPGRNRPLSAVLIGKGFHFRILRTGKEGRLKELNNCISHLRRL